MTANLPGFYAITGSLESDGSDRPVLEQDAGCHWFKRFERLVVASNVGLIQLRVKKLEVAHLEQVVGVCQELAARHDSMLLLNGPADTVSRFGVAGVHLTSRALLDSHERPLPSAYLVGASCHSSSELQHAEQIGCDFACLSPVKQTKCYKREEVLGMERFSDLVRECNIPVYGLGGLAFDDLDDIRSAGGQGVAGISAFW